MTRPLTRAEEAALTLAIFAQYDRRAAYNATWRRWPNPRNPAHTRRVDRALDQLEAAEARVSRMKACRDRGRPELILAC